MGRSKKPTAAEMKKIRLVKMIQEVTSSGSSKDTWNPAEISEGLKNINFIRRLVDTWNPAQLNEAIRRLGFKTIDTWNPAIIDEMKAALIRIFALHSVTGNPITLNLTGELPYLIKEATVTFFPKQSGTGDPSPTNIRPISGWNGLNLTRTGKNVCPIEYIGTSTSNAFKLKAGSYTFSFTLKGTARYSTSNISVRDGNTVLSQIIVYGKEVGERLSTSFTLTEEHTVTIFNANVYVDTDGKSADDIQIEFGTETAYEPYQGETYPATFESTLYGGSYDFVSGEGTSNYGMVDLGDLNYTYVSENAYFYAIVSNIYIPEQSSERNKGLISSQYKLAAGTSANNMTNGEMLRASGRVYIKNTDYTGVDEFKAAMDGVQLCYELATPTLIELTGQEVEPLPGINVFSTDSDTLNIKYQIDLS